MLRAAPWNLGRKQKLRLLTRPLSQFRYTLSTSNIPHATAQQHVADPPGDERAPSQPAPRAAEPTNPYPKPITNSNGPLWDVMSPPEPGASRRKITKQESRARNRKIRFLRDTELNKFHEHVQQRLTTLPPFDEASLLPRNREAISMPESDFARKFTARRSDAVQPHKSGPNSAHNELASDMALEDRIEVGGLNRASLTTDVSIAQREDGKVDKNDAALHENIPLWHDQTTPQEPELAPLSQSFPLSDPSHSTDSHLRRHRAINAEPSDNALTAQLKDRAQQGRMTDGSPRNENSDGFAGSTVHGIRQREPNPSFLGLLHEMLKGRAWSNQEESGEDRSPTHLPRESEADDSTLARHENTQSLESDKQAPGFHDPATTNDSISAEAQNQQPGSLPVSSPAGLSADATSALDDAAARPPSADVHFRDTFSKIFDNSETPSTDEPAVSSEHHEGGNALGLQPRSFKDHLEEMVDQIDRIEHEAPLDVTETEPPSTDDCQVRNERKHVATEKFTLQDESLGFSYATLAKAPSSNFDKSWEGSGPSWWIHCCVSGHRDQHLWRTHIAKLRTVRPPILAIQLLTRRDALRLNKTDGRRSILQYLPQGEARSLLLRKMATLGVNRSYLNSICDVLEANSDEERCRRFLKAGVPKPIWLLNFLLRPQSSIQDPRTLSALIDYSATTFCQTWKNFDQGDADSEVSKVDIASEAIAPEDFAHVVLLFAIRAMTVETRLLPRIAEMAAQYIQNMSSADWHPSKIFFDQCELFNAALAAFRPSKLRVPSTVHRLMPPYWEAQRILLNMSTNLPKQLLVDRLGYQSVREVLSMLNKDQNEMHNALRHRESWPPYLDPSDGIDEASDPEANWSRAVSAGTLQQDAGYSLSPQDEVLDILQGRASNLTPTIRQRVTNVPHPNVSPWEASIRATRNTQEAWDRFRYPPHPDAKPGAHEYGALLTKYLTHEVSPDDMELPGDKALIFPTKEDPNLTDFEKVRRRPPTLGTLLEMMGQSEIKLTGALLVRLLSQNGYVSEFLTGTGGQNRSQKKSLHASHVRTARIFKLSDLPREQYAPLLETKVKDWHALRKVPLPIFAAYIQHLASFRPLAPQLLMRAMHFCEARFLNDKEAAPWAQHCWGMLLKSTARRPRDARVLTVGLVSQINTYNYVLSSITAQAPLTLSTTMEFAKSVSKASRRVLAENWADAGDEKKLLKSPLVALYGRESQRGSVEQRTTGIKPDCIPMMQSLCRLVARLTKTVKALIDYEAKVQGLLAAPLAQTVDEMMARSDPVRAGEAERLMVTWAYAGEYETMAWYLEWLVEQWDSTRLQEELQNLLAVPPIADFTASLAIFQRYAEPFLPADRVTSMRQKIADARVIWQWPTPEIVEEKLGGSNRARARLQYVQTWTRFWQAQARNEDVGHLKLPGHWSEFWEKRVPDREEEEMDLPTELPPNWDGIPWPKNSM